ncbi:MAG: UvrD-helicase domain-containing protein [Candidatus Zambryskibacteria bacterium]|nr:UvrD-helicase domain-containing protein [Candidatus Zambryskibacteria bacterium]
MNTTSDYLSGLNDKQKIAVLATEGPVLIIAGAGAGKTKTITHRILHLIKQGIHPHNILAITFTNKAGKEMRERVEHLLLADPVLKAQNHNAVPFVSTFHSLGVFMIKQWADRLGLPRHFGIFDKTDSKKALKKALESLNVEPKEHLDKVAGIISREKGLGVSYEQFVSRQSYDFTSDITGRAWKIYEDTLRKEKALDFDDLLLKSLELLEKHLDIRTYYQNLWQYVHVDEYQDTNKVQHKLIDILLDKNQNLCVVGDVDQSIYGWRGAEIKNMLSFEKKYPHAHVVLLEQNYRSTKMILKVANEVISKNKWRIPKNLFTENTEGEKVSVYEGFNEVDEAHFIAQRSKEIIESGIKPDEIAVLFRANFQSRILEEAFLAYGVPYQMLGTKFFERKEIKDMLSYIKSALNPESSLDLARIINVPPRGIGKVTLDKIEAGEEAGLPIKTQEKIRLFKEMLVRIKGFMLTHKVSESMRYIVDISGMQEAYAKGNDEDQERLENIMELVTLATGYDELLPEEGIEQLLTDAALVSDQDSLKKETTGVKLMTVHSSKGLEFDYVFISGMEEDLFPHRRFGEKKKEGEESEEERRLFYVAVTRARKKLYLTLAQMRTIFGSKQINTPSQFIADINEDFLDQEKKSMMGPARGGGGGRYFSIDF